jgi:hypothetical protein
MAFTVTKNVQEGHFGVVKITSGTYTSDGGSTGGDINTSLAIILAMYLQPKGSSVLSDQSVVNETLPKSTDGITIKTAANQVGTWIAVGM